MTSRSTITVISLFLCSSIVAQPLEYPTTAQLRTSLQQLTASNARRYSDIDNGPLDASDPDYRKASFHLVPNTRNQLYMAAGPANDSYMEFMAEGINEQQAITGFATWEKLFVAAGPEFLFVSHNHDTYGEAIYYCDAVQINMFVLEKYYNPVKKTWTISLSLRHPSADDKKFIYKKDHPEEFIDAQQKAITTSLIALLKARTNKFQSFRGIELPGTDGTTTYGVVGASFGYDPGPVTFINVDASGTTTFQLIAAGFDMPVQITVTYATLITPELEKEGYSITKEEIGTDVTYSILYNGIPVSACKLEKAKGVATVVIMGN